jgi:hypothetical protein
MTTKIDDLLTKMELTRNRLNSNIEKATPQVELYPSWNLKHLIDHITGWDELVVTAFHAYSKGETPEMVVKQGIDQFNAESVSAREELSLESSRYAFDTARVELLKAVREIPAETAAQKFPAPWGGMCTVNSVLRILISHEAEHAQHLEEKLNNPTDSA